MTQHIREKDFWGKLAKLPRSAGREVVEKALTLYVLLSEKDVPLWAKTSIVASLAYFLWPLDAVPDFLPGGYLDDLAAMALLLSELHIFATPELKRKVEELLPQWAKAHPCLPERSGEKHAETYIS